MCAPLPGEKNPFGTTRTDLSCYTTATDYPTTLPVVKVKSRENAVPLSVPLIVTE